MHLFTLSGKTAVVTGASGALGGAMAQGLSQYGAHVVLCYGRNRAGVESVADTMRGTGIQSRIEISQVDALNPVAVGTHAATVRRDFGSIDILVNCAGGNVPSAITDGKKTFFDLELVGLQKVVQLNLFGGCLIPCLYYGREMRDNPLGGSIINITSMNAFRPLEGRPGYAASKAAVANFTRWLASHVALECNPAVRVNAIAPGFIPNTRTYSGIYAENGGYTKRGQRIIDKTPMRRLGTPEDLVGTCIWYASDASSFVTGTVTPVDGGFNAYAGV